MAEGLMLMGVGMTTVFAFLVVMVGAMMVQASLFRRFDIEFEPMRGSLSDSSKSNQSHLHIAIALAAIESHRRRTGS